jgi:hypothetical protein
MNRLTGGVERDTSQAVRPVLIYESSVSVLKAAFGQALVATFREVLFVFLQALENEAVARLHCQTEPLHIFDAGKLISLSFLPAYQPLPDDRLTWCIQPLEALYRATPPIFTR